MIYVNEVEIGGKKKNVVTINHRDEDEIVAVLETKIVSKIHHIHILDRSGSMYTQINYLIDNVQKTIDVIGEEDFISIIWFSSPGQYKVLVKGAKKSKELVKMLDTIRFTLGTTCFSQPLAETNTVIDDLFSLCPNVSVTLFTDGQPVVPWSVSEEENKIFKELERMKSKIIAFNTIGYGNWYNRDLLVKMSQMSEFGSFVHSSRIEEYLDIFSKNFVTISGVIFEGINVQGPKNSDIIYLTRNFTKMEKENLELTRVDARKNQIFIVGDGDFVFEYQGQMYDTRAIPGVSNEATMKNFWYAYAYNLYYKNERQKCLDILGKELRDKALVDQQMSAFTYDECGEFSESLQKAVFDNNSRLTKGLAVKNYIPADDAVCVMDVLKVLQEGNAFYIPFSDKVEEYKRITRKTEEQFDLFEMTNAEVKVPFSDFVYNKKNLNLSILMWIPGTVSLNPKAAKSVKLPEKVDSGIFRNHTIIKDGTLNIKKIEILTDKDTHDELKKLVPNSVFAHQSMRKRAVDKETPYDLVLNLAKLPIINRTYIAEATVDHLFEDTVAITQLEAKQKVVGYYIDKVLEEGPASLRKQGELTEYTLKQIEVLEQHGLDKYLRYNGVKKERPKAEESDFYETRTMEFYLSGCSSWPKMKDIEERIAKKKSLTFSMELMHAADEEIKAAIKKAKLSLEKPTVQLRDFLQEIEGSVKEELIDYRAKLNGIKMAKILTADWFPGLVANDKGEYLYTKDDKTMVAKVDRTRVYI